MELIIAKVLVVALVVATIIVFVRANRSRP